MKRRELPEFLQVPWGPRDVLLFVAGWFSLQVMLGMVLGALGTRVPAIHHFMQGVRSGSAIPNFVLYFAGVLMGLGLVWAFARHYRVGWQALGWRKINIWRTLGYILGILMIFFILVQAVLLVVKLLVPSFDPNQAQNNDFTQSANSNRSLALVALVLLPPIFEETIFRGFIFPAIAKRSGLIWGAVISSAIFGIAHGQANIFVYTMILGLLLCFLYVRTRSIVPGILVHMVNNLLAFYALTHK